MKKLLCLALLTCAACSAGSSTSSSSGGASGTAGGGLEGTWDLQTFSLASGVKADPFAFTIAGGKVTGKNSSTTVDISFSSTAMAGTVESSSGTCTFSATRTAGRPSTLTPLDGDWDATFANCKRAVDGRKYKLVIDGGSFKARADAADDNDALAGALVGNTLTASGPFSFAASRR